MLETPGTLGYATRHRIDGTKPPSVKPLPTAPPAIGRSPYYKRPLRRRPGYRRADPSWLRSDVARSGIPKVFRMDAALSSMSV